MIGVITGDIVGSVYEFKKRFPYSFDPLFHLKAKFTDDTICSLAVMDAILQDASPRNTLHSWGREFWSTGGWGKMFVRWLASKEPEPYGSYGNGAAMRIAAVGWVGQSVSQVIEMSDRFTEITHNHPDGMKSARAVALAVYFARRGMRAEDIREVLSEYYDLDFAISDVIDDYQRTEVAEESVPHAIVCALEATTFEDAIRKAVSLGGDTDTQAAIAGGIAEARFGVPDDIQEQALTYLTPKMLDVVETFYERYVARS